MTHPALNTRAKRTKPKKCALKSCGATYTPRPGAKPFENWCSYDCAVAITREKQTATLKRKRLAQTKADREWKKANQTVSEAIQLAETSVRRYCRIRDAEDPCISCGRSVAEVESAPYQPGGYWDGGHFIGKGECPAIRFLTTNIHKQCKSCNGGSGQYVRKGITVRAAYEARLKSKIGAAKVEWLKGQHLQLQPRVEYLQRMKCVFDKRARHLKKLRGYSD